jgi:endonuclease YncB( thermonuclease family)
MRRTLASLLLAGLLSACGPDLALDALAPGGHGRVAGTPAGDALVLAGGGQVRLAGVEAPKGDEPYAAESRAALSRLALGREVELLQGGAREDAYGRTLAQVRDTRRRLWLQGALLRDGAVRVRTYADDRAMAAPMLLAEARARAAHRGLWALPAYRVRLPQEVAQDQRGLVVLEGRVRSVLRDGGRLRLDFVEAPAGLAAEIPRTAWDAFAAAGLAPQALAGRLLRLRGGVRPSGGGRPVLWLDHPEQVERLAAPAG